MDWTFLHERTGVTVTVNRCLHGRARRYLADQPLRLLLAAAVYDLPTGTVLLCLAADSALVGRSTTLARQSGTRCQMNLEIRTAWIVLNGS